MRISLFLGLGALVASVSAAPTRRATKTTDSGLRVSDVESDWPDEPTMTRVLTTAPNKAVFWTGRNGGVSVEGKALLVAKSFGANTLEGSLAAGNLIMPDFDFSNPKTVEIWTFASQTFAKLATGESFVVTGRNVREGNIFHKEELPRMKKNKKITKITKIDSTTGRRTVVFDRNASKEDAAVNEANLRRDACKEKPPFVTVPRRSNSFRRSLSSLEREAEKFAKRAAPPARAARKNTGAAPACPLPGAAQSKKVVARSNTAVKEPPARSFPAGGKKPTAKAPAAKRKVPRPANRPRRAKGAAAPPRKRITPKKKPKKVPKPPAKAKGKARRRR